jgi:hypothetical protein
MAWSGRSSRTPSYTIKKKVQVKQKKRWLSFGGEIGANTQLNTPAAKANLLFQNKRNDDFSSYDTNQTIWMGIISLF